ncbi:fluoride efflux transporter CrcB [Nakamurella sp. UYEF19]|uniref:fluoride efflux transporter CrcB n=1 Tax=Nakamurella sp. UYEF19 TaxID=1756392 RepID=UPI003395CE9C
MDYLLVAAGAAVGAPLRYLTDRLVQSRRRGTFPFGTLTVNVIGSAILGGVTAATLSGAPGTLQVLVGTGFCGALTTYSTFSYETARLWQDDATRQSIVNVVVTLVAGIGAAVAGFAIVNGLS